MTRFVLSLAFAVALFAAPPPLSTADVWAWRTVTDPQIRPDGAQVVYVLGASDRMKDAMYSSLWLAPVDGKPPRPLTAGPYQDTSPRWSPDGTPDRVSFQAQRQAADPRALDGQRTGGRDHAAGGGAFEHRVVARRPLHCVSGARARQAGLVRRHAGEAGGRGVGAAAGRSSRACTGATTARGSCRRATRISSSCPRRAALRARSRAAISTTGASPRGCRTAAPSCSPPCAQPDAEYSLEGDEIYAFDVTGGTVRQLTNHPGPDEGPVPSPDGSKIAFIGNDYKQQSYFVRKLYVMNADGSRLRVISGLHDRDVVRPRWSNDSRTVYFVSDDRGGSAPLRGAP